MPRLPLLAGIAAAAIAVSTQAHAHWVRGYPHFYFYPYPYAIAPRYVVPVVPYAYVAPLPLVVQREYVVPAPRAPEPPQYSYDERTERSRAQIVPPVAAARVTERITLSAKELFDFDSAKLRLPQPRLDEVAAAMNNNPQIGMIRITGYTDRIGEPSYNIKLSQRRADAVKAYLVSKGVASTRLLAEGKGDANPVVQCSDEKKADLIQCLEPNRRVEVEEITIEKRVTT